MNSNYSNETTQCNNAQPYGQQPYGQQPYGQQQYGAPAPKPDNNMVWAILCTVCCCLPLGILGIIKASSVNSLYASGNVDAAYAAAEDAKKWSTWGIIIGLVINVIYFFIVVLSANF